MLLSSWESHRYLELFMIDADDGIGTRNPDHDRVCYMMSPIQSCIDWFAGPKIRIVGLVFACC